MKLVTYQDHHFEGLDHLWRECFPMDPPRNRATRSPRAKQAIGAHLGGDLIIVAEAQGGRVIGTIMAGYDGHRGWLYTVAVAQPERRSGIGKALVEET